MNNQALVSWPHKATRIAVVLILLCSSGVYGQKPSRRGAHKHYEKGVKLLEKQQLDEAIAELLAATKLNPKLADAHKALGIALTQKGELQAAGESFNKAIQINPTLYQAHIGLINVLKQTGDLEGAIAISKKALALKPREVDAHLLLGQVYQQNRDLDSAISQFREAIQINPNLAEPHFHLGFALGVKGLLKDSIPELALALTYRVIIWQLSSILLLRFADRYFSGGPIPGNSAH